MSRLRDYPSQVQSVIEKGIRSVEKQHQAVAGKSFDYALKLEEEAKSYSVSSLRERHDQMIGNMYECIIGVNRRVSDLAADLVARLEGQARVVEGEVAEIAETVEQAEQDVQKQVRKSTAKVRASAGKSARAATARVQDATGSVEESLN